MDIFTNSSAQIPSTVCTLLPGWSVAEKISNLYSFIGEKLPQCDSIELAAIGMELLAKGRWRDLCLLHDMISVLTSPIPVSYGETARLRDFREDAMIDYVKQESIDMGYNIVQNVNVNEMFKDNAVLTNTTGPLHVSSIGQLEDNNVSQDKVESVGQLKSAETDQTSSDDKSSSGKTDPSAEEEICAENVASKNFEDNHENKSDGCPIKNDPGNEFRGFKCLFCNLELKTSRRLKMHIRKKHQKRELKCSDCDKTFLAKETLAQHIKLQHGVKCDTCQQPFRKASDLNKHMKQDHLEQYIETLRKRSFAAQLGKDSCPVCLIITTSSSDLLSHFRQMHMGLDQGNMKRGSDGLFKCLLCDFSTKKIRNLRDHMRRKHLEKKFQCPICNKLFGMEKNLRSHVSNHGHVNTNTFICSECGKMYKTKQGLNIHVQIHHENKDPSVVCPVEKVLCGICGVLLRSKYDLKDHMNKHNDIKPYSCDQCDMSFYNKANLRSHKKSHIEHGNHVCDICAKTYSTSQTLKLHRKIHFNETKSYQCEVCNKTFTQSGALRRHERIHTGEKPYPCRLCGQTFSDYSILRRHLMGVHKSNDRSLLRKEGIEEWDKDGIRIGRKPKEAGLFDSTETVREKYQPVFPQHPVFKQ